MVKEEPIVRVLEADYSRRYDGSESLSSLLLSQDIGTELHISNRAWHV